MKSAVEWYQNAIFEILKEKENLSDEIFLQNILNAHLQAKEMEKQQHNKTFVEGLYCESGDSEEFEKYFNRTFKQQEQ